MNLPNARHAIVERQKVVEYLLNKAHPDNGGKAQFFETLGFFHHNPDALTSSLCHLASSASVTRTVKSIHGEKYVVDGTLQGPGGVVALVRTIWIIDLGTTIPRLVTAYPKG